MTKRTPIHELSREELDRAVALAAEMYERERHGDDAPPVETADRMPFLARAVRVVRAEHLHRSEQRFVRGAAMVALGVLVALAIDLGYSIRRRATAPPTVAAAVTPALAAAPLLLTLPPPGDTTLSAIPVPPGFKLNLHSYDSGDPTSITFTNALDHPVNLDWIDYRGRFQPDYRLRPGETHRVLLMFNQPIVALDDQGRNLGLYYPAGIPTTATISNQPPARRASDLHGYLRSADPDRFPTQVRKGALHAATEPAPNGLAVAWVTVLNMRRETVNLYEMNPDGTASFIGPLNSGEMFAGASQFDVRWLVVDKRGRVIVMYDSPVVDRVAVILPNSA